MKRRTEKREERREKREREAAEERREKMTSVEQRRQGGGIDEFELQDLDQVDDLLIRPGRGSSKHDRASGLTRGGLCCRKEVLRLIFLSLLFFACGALVGHVTVR